MSALPVGKSESRDIQLIALRLVMAYLSQDWDAYADILDEEVGGANELAGHLYALINHLVALAVGGYIGRTECECDSHLSDMYDSEEERLEALDDLCKRAALIPQSQIAVLLGLAPVAKMQRAAVLDMLPSSLRDKFGDDTNDEEEQWR